MNKSNNKIIISIIFCILILFGGNLSAEIVVKRGFPYYERNLPTAKDGYRLRNYPLYYRNYLYRPYDYTRPDALYRYWNGGHNFYEYEYHRWHKTAKDSWRDGHDI